VIAYYVHHQGSGHAHRAGAIADRLRTPVVGLGSGPAPAGWPGRWVRLPDDSGGPADDAAAGGTLHWAPRRHPGLRDRMRLISEALADATLLVVDVSVEVALLGRLHGVPVVVMAQPGDRTDRPHRLAYDLAERLLAPWPERPAADWPAAWTAKTVHLGAVSRFDGRPAHGPGDARRVLAFWGSGGLDVGAAEMCAAADATPGWSWDVIGPPAGVTGPANLTWRGWVDDVWPELGGAGVVVTHAGQNALAEVAAARRAAVVVPQRRPHAEQTATGEALARAGLGVVVPVWPAPGEWPGVLSEAQARGGADWKGWSPGDGAARAAALLDGLAATPIPTATPSEEHPA
jgi:Glycosyltransferase family 28 C-terminal domain